MEVNKFKGDRNIAYAFLPPRRQTGWDVYRKNLLWVEHGSSIQSGRGSSEFKASLFYIASSRSDRAT